MEEQFIVGSLGVLESFEEYFNTLHGKPVLLFSPSKAREVARKLIASADRVESILKNEPS